MASEAETRWLEHYLEYGNAKEAVRQVFPDTGLDAQDRDRAITVRASQLKRKLANEIDQHVREMIKNDAPEMFKIIRDLARQAQSETVKLNAGLRWVEMAGHKEPTIIQDQRESAQELQHKAQSLLADPETIRALTANPEVAEQLRKALQGTTH